MMAFKRISKMGWPVMIGLCLLGIHMLGLYVAPLRTELRDTERQIRDRKAQIAYLEAELSARASLDRLNRINDMMYGYVAPRPDQYLNGEQALASLGKGAPQARTVMASVADGEDEALEGNAPLAGAIGDVDESLPDLSMPVPTKSGKPTDATARATAEHRRTERMAAIDRQLLAEETLQSIKVENAEQGVKP